MSGQKVPIKCSVNYISFSAHTDFKQTTQFIRALKPPHIVSLAVNFDARSAPDLQLNTLQIIKFIA